MAKLSPSALLLSLLLAPALAQTPPPDDLQSLRAKRKSDILAVANDPSLTLDQKKEVIKGIRRGYAKRIRALKPDAPDAAAPAVDANAAPAPATASAPAAGPEARRQLRAQRKADILAVADDKSLTLDQQKAKIAVIRADYAERLRKAGAAEPAEAAAPAATPTSAAPAAAATQTPAPTPAPGRPVGRARSRQLDNELAP